MKKKVNSIIISLILILCLILILTMSKEVMESVSFSLDIWIHNLIPTLFPFLILSNFFNSYGISNILSEILKPFVERILKIKGICGYAIVMSMFSGFPSNSKFIKNLLDQKYINIDEATHLLSFCHFASPLFVIGTIGVSFLYNKTLGILILISHYLGAFITSYFFRSKNKFSYSKVNLKKAFHEMQEIQYKNEGFVPILKKSIKDSLDVLFLLFGIITFFLIGTTIISKVLNLNNITFSIFSGALEMTQGIKNIAMSSFSIEKQALFMLAFISFGGFSIHTQVFSILEDYNISYLKYLLARILHVVFSCLILSILMIIIC